MIEVTLINGTEIVLNSDMIEFIESTPDTLVSLSTGKKMLVKESVQEVVDRIIGFRRKIGIVAKDFEVLPEKPETGFERE